MVVKMAIFEYMPMIRKAKAFVLGFKSWDWSIVKSKS